MPGRVVRAADASPAVPVPPVHVRRDEELSSDLRSRQEAPASAGDHRGRGWIFSGEERLHPARRPELLGARMSTTTTARVAGDLGNFADERVGASKGVKFLARKIFPDHWSFMLGEVAL